MKLVRSYIHRDLGKMHDPVTFTIPDGDWTVDGETIPDNSKQALMQHMAQYLQDAYAGKSLEDGIAAITTKLTKLLSGDVTIKGAGVDSFTKTCRIVARELIRATYDRSDEKKYSDFTSKSAADQLADVERMIDKNKKTVEEEAKKRIKAKKAVTEIDIEFDLDELPDAE